MARRSVALLSVLAAALLWRLVVCVRTEWSIDSDEAVVGLMARHIGRGEAFPVWYYGQPYMGSLEAWAAAPAVSALGTTGVPLRLTALAFALAFVGLAWALVRRTLGDAAALGAGLYLAVGPLVLSVWSLKLRGGYVSLLALGTLALVLARAIGTRERDGAGRLAPALGLVAGVATWLNLLALPFLAAAGLYLVSRRRLVTRARPLVGATLGFLAGSAPFWIDNLRSGGATFRYFTRPNPDAPGAVGGALATFLGEHLPQLLGVTAPWEPGLAEALDARAAVLVLFAVALVGFVVRERASLLRCATLSRGPTSGAELFALHALVFAGCLLLTDYGETDSSRYAVVLYLPIAAVLGHAFAGAWERGGAWRTGSAAALALLLAFNAFTVLRHGPPEGEPGRAGAYKAFRGSVALDELYAILEEERIEGLAADPWTGPRVAYETDERTVASPSRYPPHEARFRATDRIAWAVFERGADAARMAGLFERLDRLGLATRRRDAAGYRVELIDDAGHDARAWSTARPTGAAAFDRDPRSGWSAGRAPRALSIDLGGELELGRLSALFDEGELAAELVVETSLDGVRWREVLRRREPPRVLAAPLEPHRARHLRVTGRALRHGWALQELLLFPPGP